MAARPWSRADLKRRCGELRRAVVRAGSGTEEEIDRYWPGGAINTEQHPVGKWIFCHSNLVRMLGRTEQRDSNAAVHRAVSASLVAEPVLVTLTDGSARQVFPKSYHALRWLDTLDHAIGEMASRLRALKTLEGNEQLPAETVAPVSESLAVRLWAWVITEGGPDGPATLPFDENAAPEPPDWTRTLTPEDLIFLAQAHGEVNASRLKIISDAFPADASGGSRLSLAGFLGTVAQEMGVRPADLLRRWSLGEVFAQAVTSAEAAREARARAEANTTKRAG